MSILQVHLRVSYLFFTWILIMRFLEKVQKKNPIELLKAINKHIMKKGDYVEFGKYLGQSIIWKIVEIDIEKPILFSENILCTKCFDASKSGTYADGNNNERFGSNDWLQSCLREWLNTVGRVNWAMSSPNIHAIKDFNNYEDEPGFLTEFPPKEIEFIDKQVISINSKGKQTSFIQYVHLASYENYISWAGSVIKKKPTVSAVKNDKNKATNINEVYPYLIDHKNEKGEVSYVGVDGCVYKTQPANGRMGIVPVLRLINLEAACGNGSKTNPWKIIREIIGEEY